MITTTFIRKAILAILITAAIIGFLVEPLDDSPTWEADFYSSKFIGFGSALLAKKLHQLWFETYKSTSEDD